MVQGGRLGTEGEEIWWATHNTQDHSIEDLKRTLTFITQYTEHHAVTGLVVWYKEEGLGLKEKRSGGWRNNMRAHYVENLKHTLTHRHNTKAHSIEDLKRTLTFITQYAEHHAFVLPGRVPWFKRRDVKLLPSSEAWCEASSFVRDERKPRSTVSTRLRWKILIWRNFGLQNVG